MNNESDWKIGTISYVDREVIEFKCSASDISDRIMNGDIREIKSLNQYLFAYLSTSSKILFKVVSIKEQEHFYGESAEEKSKDQYIFRAIPLGQFDKSGYRPGVAELPMVGSNIYACTSSDLIHIFSETNGLPQTIGSLIGYNSIRPAIDIAKFFSGHTVITGNTGSGKSTTARLLIKQLHNSFNSKSHVIKDKTKIVIFDVHGDYQTLFMPSHYDEILHPEDYHLCTGNLTMDDWSSILSPSEKIQKPLFDRACKYSRLTEEGKQKLYAYFAYTAIADTTLDSHALRKNQIYKYYRLIRTQLNSDIANDQKESSAIKNLVREEISKNDKSYGNRSVAHKASPNNDKSPQLADKLFGLYKLKYGNTPLQVKTELQQILKHFFYKGINKKTESDELNLDDLFNSSSSSDKRYIKDRSDITLGDLRDALDFVFDEEEVQGNHQIRAYSTGLMTRLNDLYDKYANNLFNVNNGKEISQIINDNNGIIVLEFPSSIDSTGLKLISTFLSRYLFTRQQEIREKENQNTSDLEEDQQAPVILIFDEAHRYIREADLSDDSIFNQIAREGRKFGCYLMVISQIPSELSRVVLSQANTFIIHRIQNSVDLEYLRKNVPSITDDQIMRLPSFAPGMAFIFGNSMKIPIEIQIDGTYKDITQDVSILMNKPKGI